MTIFVISLAIGATAALGYYFGHRDGRQSMKRDIVRSIRSSATMRRKFYIDESDQTAARALDNAADRAELYS